MDELETALLQICDVLSHVCGELEESAKRLWLLAGQQLYDPAAWMFPVGSEQFPTEMWYCAQYHTYDRDANPRGHTGLDLNVDKAPWGDVDRGQPVFALAEGVVHDAGYSPGWLGVVVVRVEHAGEPLWVRYAHLDWASVRVDPGDVIVVGQELGRLGDYVRGDHLHFDMATTPFGWNYWRSRSVDWVDPLPILRAHLDAAQVDAMLEKQ